MSKYAELDPVPGQTVVEARRWLREHDEEGAICPCCTQLVRVYRRRIHATMASRLIRFYRRYGLDYGSLPKLTLGGAESDFGKLRYWDLIEEADLERQDGGRAGWWRVTVAGEWWVQGLSRIPLHALIYDSRLLRLEGRRIGVVEALGKRFNYAELMGRSI